MWAHSSVVERPLCNTDGGGSIPLPRVFPYLFRKKKEGAVNEVYVHAHPPWMSRTFS